jgi:hypothetical protein
MFSELLHKMSITLRCWLTFDLGRNSINNAQLESKRELLIGRLEQVFARTENEKSDNNRRDGVYYFKR